MSRYGYNSRAATRSPGDYHERAFRRQGLAEWDARWHALSPAARLEFLRSVKGPSREQADHAPTYQVAKDRFPPGVVDELVAAGFLQVLPPRSKKAGDRVFVPAALFDFATRVRMLDRFRGLLAGDRPDLLLHYVQYAFDPYKLLAVVHAAIRGAGVDGPFDLGSLLSRYVRNRRWPGWFLAMKKDPAADRVLAAAREAGGPIPVVGLPGRVAGMAPDDARAAMDRLIAGLVLFEGLDPETSEIVVDLLAPVREGLALADRPRSRPPMAPPGRIAEIGPDEGPIVADLRAFLLEVIADPPRLRQDRGLFQKEGDRFLDAMGPLPSWLSGLLGWSDERRCDLALAWARQLSLVEDLVEGPRSRLGPTIRGRKWLSEGPDEQYASVYRAVAPTPSRKSEPILYWYLFADAAARGYYWSFRDDAAFLGPSVLVRKLAEGPKGPKRPASAYWEPKPEDFLALRRSLDRALTTLEPGTFYRLEDVAAHLAFGEHNPIHLGLPAEKVVVYRGDEVVPPLEELREEAGRSLIAGFLAHRLVPMGAVRAAVDAEGNVCVARGPRLDAYFGRGMPASESTPAGAADASRVVVQPDFSVILIGPVASAAADLAPFCDRAAPGTSGGAMILKLTRESVIRAVANGIEPARILGRLREHASHELPANVVGEVREWAGRVRRVELEAIYVLRCPDPETAGRVAGALKGRAERLNEATIAVDGKLASADRAKLRAQGILVEGHADPTAGRARTRPRARGRRSW